MSSSQNNFSVFSIIDEEKMCVFSKKKKNINSNKYLNRKIMRVNAFCSNNTSRVVCPVPTIHLRMFIQSWKRKKTCRYVNSLHKCMYAFEWSFSIDIMFEARALQPNVDFTRQNQREQPMM